MEEISKFLGGDIDEVVLFGLAGLHPDEVLALFVVVLAEQLQELEGAAVGGDAELVVEVLVGGVGLEDVLAEGVALGHVVVVVVVHCVGGELSRAFLFARACLNDGLLDEHTQLFNQGLDVLEHLVLCVLVELLNDVLLGEGVSAEEVGDSAEEDGVGQFYVVCDVFLE